MRRVWFFLLLLVCAVSAAVMFVYPMSIVQPFKHQQADQLLRALTVFRIGPWIGLAMAAIALIATIFMWRSLRIWGRIGAALLTLLAIGAGALTRVNVYEIMFHPAGAPQFLSIKAAKLDPTDMLTTVSLHGEAHAYPIREMGYHHVINDVVGGVPIVATY